MKGIKFYLYLFLVDPQKRFGGIGDRYTSEIKGESFCKYD